jgi:hypothetical protein
VLAPHISFTAGRSQQLRQHMHRSRTAADLITLISQTHKRSSSSRAAAGAAAGSSSRSCFVDSL